MKHGWVFESELIAINLGSGEATVKIVIPSLGCTLEISVEKKRLQGYYYVVGSARPIIAEHTNYLSLTIWTMCSVSSLKKKNGKVELLKAVIRFEKLTWTSEWRSTGKRQWNFMEPQCFDVSAVRSWIGKSNSWWYETKLIIRKQIKNWNWRTRNAWVWLLIASLKPLADVTAGV